MKQCERCLKHIEQEGQHTCKPTLLVETLEIAISILQNKLDGELRTKWQPIETAPVGDVEFFGWDGTRLEKTWKGWSEVDGSPVYVYSDWRSWKPTRWMTLPETPKDTP
jgi:hypothetical protein